LPEGVLPLVSKSELLPWRESELKDLPCHHRVVAQWREFDTDWKSVFVAVSLIIFVIGLDVPVPA
jgi:hypothetical protein